MRLVVIENGILGSVPEAKEVVVVIRLFPLRLPLFSLRLPWFTTWTKYYVF